ncbi:hypothetical protein DK842_17910 [Chromobacterium phragmitis]|uniref:ATP-binding protein n=1 Tax=Chromobacterium phragmitis TaxID=2202141 RepID=UPI000DECD006|nr:ATP-binding protein [Chromobacterium phragmitis]AXE31611.1 hypothetical protein DK842_17910 [Chromobacterium phragmitis]
MDELKPIGALLAEIVPATPRERAETCERHGQFTARNPIGRVWTRCPTCAQEAKDLADAEQQAREKAQAAERQRAGWLTLCGNSGIPLRFQDRTLQNYRAANDGQRIALEFAKAYAAEFEHGHSGRCAIFLGEFGTGKTHLACGIALRIMHRHQCTAVFTTLDEMARRIREAKSFDAAMSESKTIRLYTDPDLLIIDEVGVQSGTDTEARSLFAVVNGRYEARRPTIFLSNLDRDGVAASIGPRLYSRLREDGCEVLVFDWDDYRAMEAA